MENVDLITQKFIEPLNESTRRLLAPVNIQKNDHLHVGLDKDGERFYLYLYAEYEPRYNTRLDDRSLFDKVSEKRTTSVSWSAVRFIERIPERKAVYNASVKQQWLVAGTDFTALLIHSIWPHNQISFDADAKILYDYLLLRFLKQTINARIKADFKLNNIVPNMPEDFIDHPTRPLFSYQKVALATSINQEGSNLWMEQGTGKTPIVIARVCYEANQLIKKKKRMYRALIVVPKNMRMNWHNKFMDFAVEPGKLTVLRGGQLERLKLMVEAFKPDDECKYTVVICSYESVLRSWEALRMIEWDLCTLDESHMIKGHYTKRWSKMQDLRELVENKTELTGTPIANNLFDCWTQLEFLGKGLSGFTSYKSFRAYYGKFAKDDNGHDILNGYCNLPLLQERFSRLCFMMTLKEAQPYLPRETYDVLEAEMTKFQRDCYVKLQTQLAIEIEAELEKDDNKQLTANHILTKLLRLSQITSGYLKWDTLIDVEGNTSGGNIEDIPNNPKIQMIVDLLKSKKPTDKTIIWTNWVWVIKALSKRLSEEGIKCVTYYGGTSDNDRQIAQDTYNQDPEVKVFIGNPAAGGVGLDLWGHMPEWVGTDKELDTNTTQMIYYSQNWSMIHRSQSEKRATRIGTRVSVQITDLVIPKTIDEEIAVRVLNKKMSAMELQDVRAIMARILQSIPTIGKDND